MLFLSSIFNALKNTASSIWEAFVSLPTTGKALILIGFAVLFLCWGGFVSYVQQNHFSENQLKAEQERNELKDKVDKQEEEINKLKDESNNLRGQLVSKDEELKKSDERLKIIADARIKLGALYEKDKKRLDSINSIDELDRFIRTELQELYPRSNR